MSFLIKNTVGVVNFTDWLHITCSKVSEPGTIIWEDWVDAPISNYNYSIPVNDAENYYIRYYDAPTNSSLGTLHLELIVNALTSDIVFERRWYLVGGPGDHDPENGDTGLTDPYLINKTVYGVFKEAFRYFKPSDEYTFNELTGEINVINGTQFNTGERVMVEIKYSVASQSSITASGLYTFTIEAEDQTYTIDPADQNCRIVCAGSASTQKLLLPLLSAVSEGSGYFIDNSIKGTAIQPAILCNGSDNILFNGFMFGDDHFSEFWVSRGEHVLLRKRNGFWELLTDYKGVHVGEKRTVGFKSHPTILTESGQLIDGEEYPRLYWWIKNVLPGTHKYTDDGILGGGWSHNLNKTGQFAIHSTQKKFRMPKTWNLSERGLANFESYGSDTANRFWDYPGGWQNEMVGPHKHTFDPDTQPGYSDNANDRVVTIPGHSSKETGLNSGTEQRVKNNGVIYGRFI